MLSCIFSDTITYSIVWQMSLHKGNFGWLTLSSYTWEEGLKMVHFKEFSQLTQDDNESITKIVTYVYHYSKNVMCILWQTYNLTSSGHVHKPKNSTQTNSKSIMNAGYLCVLTGSF